MEALPIILDAAVGPEYKVRNSAIKRICNHLLPKAGLAPTIKAFAESRLRLLHQPAVQPLAGTDQTGQPDEPSAEAPDITLETALTLPHAGVVCSLLLTRALLLMCMP